MFQACENQKHFMYSVDPNDIFDHMRCHAPGNLLNIQNVMLKYQYLATGILHLKWNTAFHFKILHEGFFTMKIYMRIDIAKP